MSRKELIGSMQLEEHERLEEEENPLRALRGTWQHPNPSMILRGGLANFSWSYFKRHWVRITIMGILGFVFYLIMTRT
jgi:hypothetical protein